MDMPKLRFKADDGSSLPEWQQKRFGDIMKCYSGGTPSTSEKTYYGGSIPFLKSGEIHLSVTQAHITELGLANSSAKLISKGDLLYALYGATSGDVAISKIDAAINQAVLCIVPHHDNRIYLKNWLELNRNRIISKYLQGGQGNLSAKIVKSLIVPIPSIAEQHKIADLILTVDDIIDKQQAEIKAWEQYKKGLTQKLFSQEVRFKADDGSDFPAWESIPLAMACDINPKTEPLAAQFYYMDLNSVDSGQWNGPQLLQRADAPSRAQRVATLDDVFFQSVRPYNQGHYHITRLLDKQIVASTGFIQTRMRNGCNSFLYHMFFEEGFNKEINLRCTGSNYPAINATEFGKIVISLPSSPEQRKIAECLDAIDEVITLAKAELDKWRELKKGLLQQLFV